MKVKPLLLLAGAFMIFPAFAGNLGLPDVPVPVDNPQSPEKVALGDKLFNDVRFSSTGEVSCATCHDPHKHRADVSCLGRYAGRSGHWLQRACL